MRESEMLPRFNATVAGESARTVAATNPAPGPHNRRTIRYRTRTESTPSTTWGRAMAHVWTPKARTVRAWTQNAPGNLSSDTVPVGSKAAKKKLCQLVDMLLTAAA